MNTTIKSLFIGILLVISFTSYGQQNSNPIKHSNNKVNLNGQPFYIHIVGKGETLFAISQAYKVPIDTLKLDNISLSDNLSPNQYIKIRVFENDKKDDIPYIAYSVQKGDTPYNLSKRYHTTIDKIYALNPNSELGINIGQTLRIPVTEDIQDGNQDSTYLAEELADTILTNFMVHIVKKKQTIFGIAALYRVTKEEIIDANPPLKERQIQIGEAINIPINNEVAATMDDYYLHKVEKQETVYGICQLYSLKEKSLKKLNPEIKKYGLQVDRYIRIPKNKISNQIFATTDVAPTPDNKVVEEIIPEHKKTYLIDSTYFPNCPVLTFDTVTSYKVAFFLPLYLNMIDTSLTGNSVDPSIYPRSKIIVEFFEGALLAIEDLKSKGVNLDIHIFDTQNDSLKVARILNNSNLEDFSLFIGPVYGENLTLVGDYAWEHQINIVSPLSTINDFIDHNPYAFQASPPFELQMKHASEFLNDFDTKNYIVIHDGKSIEQAYIQEFKMQLFAQMNEDNYNQIKYNEVYYYDARDSVLKDVFSPGIENIVIVPSQNQAFVSDIMGKLNGYSYEYKIITFGQPRWVRFDNIELDNFHNTNTHIISNSFIDYSKDNINAFVSDYRKYFKTEPDKFAFQGYDITRYFLSALNIYGEDFRKCLHMHQIDLLQTKYNFVPITDQGGYQNSAIFILEYTDDYKIKKVASYPE